MSISKVIRLQNQNSSYPHLQISVPLSTRRLMHTLWRISGCSYFMYNQKICNSCNMAFYVILDKPATILKTRITKQYALFIYLKVLFRSGRLIIISFLVFFYFFYLLFIFYQIEILFGIYFQFSVCSFPKNENSKPITESYFLEFSKFSH